MKKLNNLQSYVVKKLIEDKILNINSILKAISEVCSEEQFNSILNILTLSQPKLKEQKKERVIVKIQTVNNKKLDTDNLWNAIKVLRKYYNITLYDAKNIIVMVNNGRTSEILTPIELEKVDDLRYELRKCNIITTYS